MFKNNRLRKTIGYGLMLSGGLLMWLAPAVWIGVLLLIAGIAIEVVGITLEHRAQR